MAVPPPLYMLKRLALTLLVGLLNKKGESEMSYKSSYAGTQIDTGLTNALNANLSTTWIPIDGSGQSLALTVSSATYTKVGKLVFLRGVITYPSSADTSLACLSGLPFAAAESTVGTAQSNAGGGFVTTELSQGAQKLYFTSATSVYAKNSTVATSQISFSVVYVATA